MKTRALKDYIPWPFLLVILMVSLFIITGGFLFYNSQKNKIINEKQNELAAIASLKISDIEKWRMEHIRDGQILSSIIPRNQLIFDFLKNESTPEFGKELLERIRIFIKDYDYHSILLVDTTGSVRLVYPPSVKHPTLNVSIHELQNPDISFSDLHFSDDLPDKIHLDMQIPLITIKNDRMVRFGTLLMIIDPEKTLYPLIQSWPTPSKSSETLLIRYEEDSVLFLNELRHQKNTALKLRLPIKGNLPDSETVSGYEGAFESLDYRRIPVISYIKQIPGSPWFMVAKVDKKEIYSPLNRLSITIPIVAFLLIFSVSSTIIYIARNQRFRYLNELNSTKDKFISIISHDLRSPFTSINGFADILLEDLQSKDKTNIDQGRIKKYAEIIKYSSQNAVDLLKNLTEWSRIQTNRMVFNRKEIDLVATTNKVIDLMNVAAMQKSITFSRSGPPELKIFADEDMISLVLRNLISNSIKFSNPGGNIHISILGKDNEVIVEVCDTGIGINKEKINKLFQMEENVTTPGTHKETGTGLGLILVKEFISLHGGQVFVESEEGKCTRFRFTVPLRSGK